MENKYVQMKENSLRKKKLNIKQKIIQQTQ